MSEQHKPTVQTSPGNQPLPISSLERGPYLPAEKGRALCRSPRPTSPTACFPLCLQRSLHGPSFLSFPQGAKKDLAFGCWWRGQGRQAAPPGGSQTHAASAVCSQKKALKTQWNAAVDTCEETTSVDLTTLFLLATKLLTPGNKRAAWRASTYAHTRAHVPYLPMTHSHRRTLRGKKPSVLKATPHNVSTYRNLAHGR